jgi:hypothetical protein
MGTDNHQAPSEDDALRCAFCARPISRSGNWADGPRYIHTGVNGSQAAYCSHAVRPLEGPSKGEMRALLVDARAEIDRWGYGDFHWGDTPRDPGVLAMLARIDASLGVTTSARYAAGES